MLTDREKEMLMIFQSLDNHEQNIVLGEISEFVLNKKKLKF